jgi:hypothetical protein
VDRIQEIVSHLAVADGTDAGADPHRWEASRLIYDDLQTGKSLRELGREIGKSHMYVQYMQRTWALGKDFCPVYDPTGLSGTTWPDFKEIFYSAEVRGEASAKPKPSRKSPKGKSDPKEQGDESLSGQIRKAAELFNMIVTNPAIADTLSEEDYAVIEAMLEDIDLLFPS